MDPKMPLPPGTASAIQGPSVAQLQLGQQVPDAYDAARNDTMLLLDQPANNSTLMRPEVLRNELAAGLLPGFCALS